MTQLPRLYDLDFTPLNARVVIVPVPFDATASYQRGAASGPDAIAEASVQVDLFDLDFAAEPGMQPADAGVAMLPVSPAVRKWNEEAISLVDRARHGHRALAADQTTAEDVDALTEQVNQLGMKVNDWVRNEVSALLERGRIVGTVGGDHSVPFAAIEAHLGAFPEMGLLHIDAHADLRDAYEGFAWSHASILRNVMDRLPLNRLVQVGIRDFCKEEHDYIHQSQGRIITWFDRTLADLRGAGKSEQEILAGIVDGLPQQVYVTLDIDGLDPTLCPHTGTPVPGGLSFQTLSALLRAVTDSGRQVVGFDLVEVAPGPDGDEWDGNVGARVLYKLCGHTLRNR